MSEATLKGLRDYLYDTLKPADMVWLGMQLTDYGRKQEAPKERYTMEDINAMIAQSEADIAAGRVTDHEEVMREWEEELEREEQEEFELAEAI